jgi:hypothetical protein
MRIVQIALAMSLLAPAVAVAAPRVQVSGGTLAIDGTDATGVSAQIAFGEVFGPPAGQGTAVRTFAYGPRFIWRGVAPVAGAGCEPRPADAQGPARILCPTFDRMDIALGRADDYLGIATDVPTHVSGGAGEDALTLFGGVDRELDGGPGADSLRMALDRGDDGTVRGGPGDDYISVEGAATVDCGPGDDDVVDDLWRYHRDDPPRIDEANCAPVLRALEISPPPGVDEFHLPLGYVPRGGRVSMRVFRPSESGRGTIQLRRARSVTRGGYPAPGTKWSPCGERRRFRMRAGRDVRTSLRLVPRIARRVAALKPPPHRFRYSPARMIACSFHISGVDDDGERFHRQDFSLLLVNPK